MFLSYASCLDFSIFLLRAGRCFHCEYKGNNIVHPAFGNYRGRETDFEELACGERRVGIEGLTLFDEHRIDFVGFLCEEDSVYFDPAVDSEFAKVMNDIAEEEEETREEFYRQTAEEGFHRVALEDDDYRDTEEEEIHEDDYSLSEDEEVLDDHNNEVLEEELHDELSRKALAI